VIDVSEFIFNKKSNLLERWEFDYPLRNVREPNLYRNLFSYSDIPKIAFNHRIVPLDMPDDIWITDTTFRDGQQSRAPYTTEQITDLYKLLARLGGPNGLVRQSEFFLYTKQDLDALYSCLSLGYEYPEPTSWIRASQKDFELVKSVGLKETGILVSCSDYHIFFKMRMDRQQVIDHYLRVISECIEMGVRPRCHFEDITRADFYGFVVPFVRALMRLMDETGVPIKIRACDTMGYGVTYPGAMLPRSVPGIIYGLHHYAGVPHELLEWHGHNDFYRAVTNASYAWLFGASAVNCSLLGIGERTGNTPLEAMIIEYAQLRGTLDGADTTVITEIAEYFEKKLKYRIPPRTPFVGRDFNVTKAGIHADGILKNEEIYNIFDTDKLLGRPCRVAVSSTSGLAGVAHWFNTRHCLSENEALDKRHPVIREIKEWVDAQYAAGRVTVITDEELSEAADAAVSHFMADSGGINRKSRTEELGI
jgi:isopropylmalate/homocitrate/citramalate synthase